MLVPALYADSASLSISSIVYGIYLIISLVTSAPIVAAVIMSLSNMNHA